MLWGALRIGFPKELGKGWPSALPNSVANLHIQLVSFATNVVPTVQVSIIEASATSYSLAGTSPLPAVQTLVHYMTVT